MRLKREMAWPKAASLAISSQDRAHRAIPGIPTNWDPYMQRDSREWNVREANLAACLILTNPIWSGLPTRRTKPRCEIKYIVQRPPIIPVAPYGGRVTQICRSGTGESFQARYQASSSLRCVSSIISHAVVTLFAWLDLGSWCRLSEPSIDWLQSGFSGDQSPFCVLAFFLSPDVLSRSARESGH